MIVAAGTLTYDYPPEIVASVGGPVSPRPQVRYVIPRDSAAATSDHDEFAVHISKLKQLMLDRSHWADDAEPPSESALMWAQLVIQQLQTDKFSPTRIVASAEGGVGVCFVEGNKYADIECLNSGAILGVTSNKSDRPIVWQVEPDSRGIARAVARIREFIVSSETSPDASGRTAGR
jgi:hypothetical protein